MCVLGDCMQGHNFISSYNLQLLKQPESQYFVLYLQIQGNKNRNRNLTVVVVVVVLSVNRETLVKQRAQLHEVRYSQFDNLLLSYFRPDFWRKNTQNNSKMTIYCFLGKKMSKFGALKILPFLSYDFFCQKQPAGSEKHFTQKCP